MDKVYIPSDIKRKVKVDSGALQKLKRGFGIISLAAKDTATKVKTDTKKIKSRVSNFGADLRKKFNSAVEIAKAWIKSKCENVRNYFDNLGSRYDVENEINNLLMKLSEKRNLSEIDSEIKKVEDAISSLQQELEQQSSNGDTFDRSSIDDITSEMYSSDDELCEVVSKYLENLRLSIDAKRSFASKEEQAKSETDEKQSVIENLNGEKQEIENIISQIIVLSSRYNFGWDEETISKRVDEIKEKRISRKK